MSHPPGKANAPATDPIAMFVDRLRDLGRQEIDGFTFEIATEAAELIESLQADLHNALEAAVQNKRLAEEYHALAYPKDRACSICGKPPPPAGHWCRHLDGCPYKPRAGGEAGTGQAGTATYEECLARLK